MDILEIAINEAGGISNLARELGVKPNVVSNWKLRENLPGPWALVLRFKYAKAIKSALKNAAQTA